MTWELISATPSPYARKVRIALQEKNLPFELKTEVPWDHTTQTPQYNPLEKLPVLIFNDGRPAVYESHFILEWLETKYPEPSLLPSIDDADNRLLVKQIEVVVDGICDALVLSFFENQRDEDKRSKPWTDRYVTYLKSLYHCATLADIYPAKCARSKAVYARSTRVSSKGRVTTSFRTA
jgi:glutathione S-transferase